MFAITTRGLEAVSAAEIAALPGVSAVETGYRRVGFAFDGALEALLALRTVDDVFVQLAVWEGIERPRTTLKRLWSLSTELHLDAVAAAIRGFRDVFAPPVFSVTASFVGKRNYSSDEIKGEVAEGIVARNGWSYEPDDAIADLNLRLFIEHATAHVGVRVGQFPLHERRYKRVHLPGSLKASVAAAMLRLAGVTPGQLVVDPCCGVGTIVIEAALSGALARGGDRDLAAVEAARTNAGVAGVAASFDVWDAQALPLADGSVDRIVANLPWGRQVAADLDIAAFYARALAEMRRVSAPEARAVVLTSQPELLYQSGWTVVEQIEISLFGQTPVIAVLAPV
jgi:23S rRNA G2445 N2-methylase RlmL